MSSTRATGRKDERLDALFHALADSTRRRLVHRLTSGPASVTELAVPFSISLAAISKHLDVLERAKILRRERDGRYQHCHLNPDALDEASAFIERYRTFWDSSLDQLAEYLEVDSPPGSKPRKRKPR